VNQHSSNGDGAAIPVPINQIRLSALKEMSMSLGAQAGLAARAKEIDANLQAHQATLEQVYNFYPLLLNHDVLPPVLEQADDSLHLSGPNTIRLAQKSYRIIQQARFVTTAPTWRSYLWMHYPQPKLPDHTLLPKNKSEEMVWRYYVTKGWHQGRQQADRIYQANLARLNRDYKGMILYHQLYAQNMVSAPFVAKTDLGITGNRTAMRIGDQVLRITALPGLNLKGRTWRAVPIPEQRLKMAYDKFGHIPSK